MHKLTKHNLFLLFFLSLGFILTSPTFASTLTWDAPSSVSQGRAFMVTVKSENPFTGVFTWRKKNIPFESKMITAPKNLADKEQREKNNQKQVPLYEAQVLLGVPHNADASMPLFMHVQESIGDKKVQTQKSATIEPLAVKWVTHNLTVEPKYVQPPKEALSRIEKEREKRALLFGHLSAPPTWELPFQRPVNGTISGSFGARRIFNNIPKSPHLGTDFRGAIGTPIRALTDGRVVLAEDHYYSGNAVYIDHGQGVLSMYGHLSEITVQKGEFVKKGDIIGKVGMTGRVTGPHLHLSLYIQGVSVDVIPFMEKELINGQLVIVGGPTPEQPRPTN